MDLASLILGSGSLVESGLDSDELHPIIRDCTLPPVPWCSPLVAILIHKPVAGQSHSLEGSYVAKFYMLLIT